MVSDHLKVDTRAVEVGIQNAKTAVKNAEEFAGISRFKATADILIAQGDSWFAYPFYNVLRFLEWRHGFRVESTAHNGEWLESMAYDPERLTDLALLFRRLKDQGRKPRAILLSGGGNDIAGPQLTVLLNHRYSQQPVLDAAIVEEMVAVRLRRDMISLITTATELSRNYFGDSAIPIFIHGYSHPVPDGRGYLGGAWILPGPWLRPAFNIKSYAMDGDDFKAAIGAMAKLINRYNEILQQIPKLPNMKHVHYVGLVDTLSNDPGRYKEDWGNELHPTRTGFERVAAIFANAVNENSAMP